MFKHSTGYVFDARIDCNGSKGIKESYKMFNKVVNMTCGIDSKGHITRAKTYTAEGFTSLRDLGVSMDKYLRSNRATYAVIGDAVYIANIRYDTRIGGCSIALYMPIQDITIDTGTKTYPGVSCYLISPTKGLHKFPVNPRMYQAMVETIKNQVSRMNLQSKEAYLTSRL